MRLGWAWWMGVLALSVQVAGCGCGDDKKGGGGDADSDTDTDTDTDTEPVCEDDDQDGHPAFDCGGDDCNDGDVLVRPGAADVPGDCEDQDCDGEGGPDEDLDGDASIICGGEDCDDRNRNFGPSATDDVGDDVDQNCDSVDGTDADGDGFASVASGGDDCDDADEMAHPDAIDNQFDLLTVDEGGATGFEPAIVSNATGDVHIAYRDSTNGDLRYAGRVNDEWTTETVDDAGDTGYDPSIGLDSSGVVHIAYRNATDGDLLHASGNAGAWELEAIDADGDTGWFSAMAIDADDAILVAYRSLTDRALMVSANSAGAWETATVDDAENTGFYPSLAVDADGTAHVSYSDQDQRLRYASQDGASWTLDPLEVDYGWGPQGWYGANSSIAIDSTGEVAIGFSDTCTVYYLWYDDDGWVANYIYGTGCVLGSPGVSLAFDADDAMHATFRGDGGAWEDPDGDLVYFTTAGGVWAYRTFDADGNTGWDSSLSTMGGIQVAYQDRGLGDLRFAGAQIDGVDQNCDGLDGVDADGDGHAEAGTGGNDCNDADARFHPGAADEVFDWRDQNCDGIDGVDGDRDGWASEESGGLDCDDADRDINPGAMEDGWDLEEVDEDGFTYWTSLQMDASDYAHVVYREGSENVIAYATNASGAWVRDVVAEEEGVDYGDLALAADGTAHVAFVRFSWEVGNEVRYATNSGRRG